MRPQESTSILSALLILIGLPPAVGDAALRCYLIVRYDDYCPEPMYPRTRPPTSIERHLFQIFEKHRAKIVVGVIPFILQYQKERDPLQVTLDDSWLTDERDPWVHLLREYVQRGVVEPALHGFEHSNFPGPPHRKGEFATRPPDWQRGAIRIGAQALQEALQRPIRVFVPPWNAWDQSITEALEEAEFTWLSPDLHHADVPETSLGILGQTTSKPAEALQWMRKIEQTSDPLLNGSVIVLVTHPFDFEPPTAFSAGHEYLRSLEQVLQYAADSPIWDCVGFQDLPDPPPTYTTRFRKAVRNHRDFELINDTFGGKMLSAAPPPAIAPVAYYETVGDGLIIPLVAIALLTFFFTAFAAAIALKLLPISIRWKKFVAILGLFLAFFLVFGAWRISENGFHVRGMRWQAIFAALGASLGALVVLRQHRKPQGPAFEQPDLSKQGASPV